jgi:hypothetical protein
VLRVIGIADPPLSAAALAAALASISSKALWDLLACFSRVLSTDLANFSWTERLLSMNSPSRNTGKEKRLR